MGHIIRESANIHAELAVQKRAISTVRQLPPELWARIFFFSLPIPESDGGHSGGCIKWNRSQPPFVFELVCRDWRQITLSTPSLWASLSIQISPGIRWKRHLDVCLERSGEVPIFLELISYLPSLSSPDEIDELPEYIDQHLLPTSGRWGCLRLFIPWQHTVRLIFGSHKMPQLKSLTLGSPSDFLVTPENLSISAPELKSLAFTVKHNPWLCRHVNWWNGITNLTLRFPLSVEDTLDILRSSPFLRQLVVRVGEMRIPPSPIYVVTVPHLQHITLLVSHREEYARFLEHITLPSLEFLEVRCTRDKPFTVGSTLVAMCKRSQCHLKTLYLNGLALGSSETSRPQEAQAILDCVKGIGTGAEVRAMSAGSELRLESLVKVLDCTSELTLASSSTPVVGRSRRPVGYL